MPTAKFTIKADGSQAERTLSNLQGKINGVGSSIKGMVGAAVGIGAIATLFNKTMQTADELVNASQQFDIPIERLQVLQQAAKDASVEFGGLKNAFDKINLAREKALGSGPDAQKYLKSFAAVGVTKEDLQTQTADQMFTGKISQFAQSHDTNSYATELKTLLGGGFRESIEVAKTNFDELGKRMQSIGAIMDTKTAKQLDAFGDSMSLYGKVILTQLAPAILSFAKVVTQIVSKLMNVFVMLGAYKESGERAKANKEDLQKRIDNAHMLEGKLREMKALPTNPDGTFKNGVMADITRRDASGKPIGASLTNVKQLAEDSLRNNLKVSKIRPSLTRV